LTGNQIIALSTERRVYWISAETRADLAEPRLWLAACENEALCGRWPLAHYQWSNHRDPARR
jgi:hypothetical protein